MISKEIVDKVWIQWLVSSNVVKWPEDLIGGIHEGSWSLEFINLFNDWLHGFGIELTHNRKQYYFKAISGNDEEITAFLLKII